MKLATSALLLVLVTVDMAAAQLPDRWKSARTPEAEGGLRECVMSHQDDWGYGADTTNLCHGEIFYVP